MKHTEETTRVVLRLAALATFLLGAGTILASPHLIRWFVGPGVQDFHFVRFIGTALVGFSVANWLYSSVKPITMALPAIYGNLASLYLAIFVDTVGIIKGTLGRSAWGVLFLHIGFAIAFTYCVLAIHKRSKRV